MMMCENCETPQFLQITKSRLYYDSVNRLTGADDPTEVHERYECTFCGATGQWYRSADGEQSITGDVYRTTEVTA
jgi:hypothetical protein